MRRGLLSAVLLLALAGAAAACGESASTKAASSKTPTCPKAWRAGWQKLANRIAAPVYCPGWIPQQVTGQIEGHSIDIKSVKSDRSYLISFLEAEHDAGGISSEVHINLRGYPGRMSVPTCLQVDLRAGVRVTHKIPCFADPRGHKRVPGIDATLYTVNQDVDMWHLLYAWRHGGSLYAISEHVIPPYTYRQVLANLNRMLRSLVLIEPS